MANALQHSIARLGNKLDEHKKDAVPSKAALDDLMPYAQQARTEFADEPLRELADSIKAIGVIEPLLVRPHGNGKLEIVAGGRRWRAARMAGLTHVPVLVKAMDDTVADQVHLAENIHRENLSTLDLAQRVERDLKAAKGSLAAVAAKYNKQKSWVSKLSAIAKGGSAMSELVDEGVTADRAVLAAVSALERKAPVQARALGEQLKTAPLKSNKRSIAERFMKQNRTAPGPTPPRTKEKSEPAREPAWRRKKEVKRALAEAQFVVELSPTSEFAGEFRRLSKELGAAQLATAVRHPDQRYAIVQFGTVGKQLRTYRADELRLLAVS